MSAIVLMASGPTVDPNAWSTPIIQQAVTWLAVVLPPLDRLCEIEWLWHGADALPVITSVAQVGAFVLLAIAVGLFDLYRRNF